MLSPQAMAAQGFAGGDTCPETAALTPAPGQEPDAGQTIALDQEPQTGCVHNYPYSCELSDNKGLWGH